MNETEWIAEIQEYIKLTRQEISITMRRMGLQTGCCERLETLIENGKIHDPQILELMDILKPRRVGDIK